MVIKFTSKFVFTIFLFFVFFTFAVTPFAHARTITELQIYEKANEIKREGWKSNVKYRMKRNTLVCSPSGKCRTLRPIGSAYRRAGGKYADYYGSAIMTKFLMEYILGKRIPFTSGDRPSSIGSARHHGGGGSRAFDLRVSTNLDEKAKVAAAWKFAAQTLGYQASVGMRYGKNSSMVHVDTVGNFGSRQWGKSPVSKKGRLVLKYYGTNRNTKMPCEVLDYVLGGGKVKCNGSSVLRNASQSDNDQIYRSVEAVMYADKYGVDINDSVYAGEYYTPVDYFDKDYEGVFDTISFDADLVAIDDANLSLRDYVTDLYRVNNDSAFISYPSFTLIEVNDLSATTLSP